MADTQVSTPTTQVAAFEYSGAKRIKFQKQLLKAFIALGRLSCLCLWLIYVALQSHYEQRSWTSKTAVHYCCNAFASIGETTCLPAFRVGSSMLIFG